MPHAVWYEKRVSNNKKKSFLDNDIIINNIPEVAFSFRNLQKKMRDKEVLNI